MTSSLNFLVTVLVIWCWALCLSPRMRRWHLSIFRWASHQPSGTLLPPRLGPLPSLFSFRSTW